MMKIIIFLTGTITLNLHVFSQNTSFVKARNELNKAHYLCWLQNWEKAYSLFSKTKPTKAFNNVDYYLFAKSALSIGKEKKFFSLINSSLDNCGDIGFWIKKDYPFYQHYYTNRQIDSLIVFYISNEKKCIDTSVQNFCKRILEVDRNNRNGKLPNEEIDLMNQEVLLDYIKKNGYPNSDIAGGDYLATVLLHINCSLLEEYLTVLLPEVKKGNLNPFFYAQMHDRRICNCRMGEAKYGAYLQPECPVPADTVITYRTKIGMSIYLNGTASSPFHLGKPTNFIHDSVIFRKKRLYH
jgi:hypothetical protein